MNSETKKANRENSGAGPSIVDLRARIPAMAQDALVSFHANALRLKESGTSVQKASAEDLLPVIEAELAARVAAKPKPAAKKAATAAAAKKKKAAKAKEEAEESEEEGAD